MSTGELMIVLLIGGALLVGPAIVFVLALVAFLRSRRIGELNRRVSELEYRLRLLARPEATSETRAVVTQNTEALAAQSPPAGTESPIVRAPAPVIASAPEADGRLTAIQGTMTPLAASKDASNSDPVGWETFIGQKAFGWIAVVLLVFSASFFLRYAYQNNWIGPVGRVAIGELVGLSLAIAGWRYFLSGWGRFSAMLTSAGVVVLYLSTYSAFGFYNLLPQQHAGFFLGILVFEAMVAAVLYRSATIALVSVIGGLLTPVLLVSDIDAYSSLFTYLLLLNISVVVALRFRPWIAVGAVALAGTQWLFWLWYHTNYHPEKFSWSLGFQLALLVLYLIHGIARRPVSTLIWAAPIQTWETLAGYLLNAVFGFIAIRALTIVDYAAWQGTIAMTMAVLYAACARLLLWRKATNNFLLLTSLAISIGFVAWTFPLQADARWVAFGWAAMGAALWMFGLRVASIPMRVMAGVLAVLAVGRLFAFDLPLYIRDPFFPVFNRIAFPSLCATICVLISVLYADRYLIRLQIQERVLIGVAGITGMCMLLMVLSFECYGYFVSQSLVQGDIATWRWRGQLALTVLWTAFATTQLFVGFRFGRSRVRWLAMALFGVTVLKVFVIDMANVQQIYRILAFFVLAVVLGLVARTYQRFR